MLDAQIQMELSFREAKMKRLVVLGGVLVAGASVIGFSQKTDVEPQVAGYMAMTTGLDVLEKIRIIPGQKQLAVKSLQGDPQKQALIAALGGQTRANATPWWESNVAGNGDSEQLATVKQKSDEKLLAAIRKKAVLDTKKSAAKNDLPQVKKNIAYDKGARSRSVLASGDAQFNSLPVKAKKAVMPEKPDQKVALLTRKERADLGRLVEEKKLPAIDLVIEFAYKSAKLSDKALPVLARIGAALTDGKLADATFVIAGHTDSVGGNRYNMDLSSQRAVSVRNYLKRVHKIADKRLVTVGYGEERLKNRQDTEAAENRRVEFINLIR